MNIWASKIYETIPCVPLKKITMPCVPPEKVQRSSAPLLQLFRALHATSVSLDSNAVKLQVWKDENALKCKYAINFFWAS